MSRISISGLLNMTVDCRVPPTNPRHSSTHRLSTGNDGISAEVRRAVEDALKTQPIPQVHIISPGPSLSPPSCSAAVLLWLRMSFNPPPPPPPPDMPSDMHHENKWCGSDLWCIGQPMDPPRPSNRRIRGADRSIYYARVFRESRILIGNCVREAVSLDGYGLLRKMLRDMSTCSLRDRHQE